MTEERYAQLVEEIRAEFPRIRLIEKERSLLQRSIDAALRLITLGRQRCYLTRYVTTIGRTVYLPLGWEARAPADRYITLRHERIHLRQFRRWTLPGMAIAYLLLPLPFGWAWCRYRFERAAYEETLRAAAEVYGPSHLCNAAFRRHVVEQFTSAAYDWMWPFHRSIERWYDRSVALLSASDPRIV